MISRVTQKIVKKKTLKVMLTIITNILFGTSMPAIAITIKLTVRSVRYKNSR